MAPKEIEGVLITHPDIIDAAVIGVPAPKVADGELPRAYLVARPGTNPDEASIKQVVAEKLARYKQCDGGIVFLESIPKTASGKILKRQLREQAKAEMQPNIKARM